MGQKLRVNFPGFESFFSSPRFASGVPATEFGRQHATVCCDVENQRMHLGGQNKHKGMGLACHVLKKDMTQVIMLCKIEGIPIDDHLYDDE